jgi:hypothetical protein
MIKTTPLNFYIEARFKNLLVYNSVLKKLKSIQTGPSQLNKQVGCGSYSPRYSSTATRIISTQSQLFTEVLRDRTLQIE